MSWIDALIFGYRTLQNGGVAVPTRSVLNFVSGGLTDNPNQSRTDYVAVGGGGGGTGGRDVPAPGAVLIANTVLGANAEWVEFGAVLGGYTLTQANAAVGRPYRFKQTKTGVGTDLLESGVGPNFSYVTLSNGGAAYLIEDPQDFRNAAAATTTFRVSGQTFTFMLDSPGGVFRCVGVS